MNDLRRVLNAAIVGFGVAFIFLIVELLAGNPLQIVDRPMHDAIERGGLHENNDVILIDLDEYSALKLGNAVNWPDIWLAPIVSQLSEAKAVAITLPLNELPPLPDTIRNLWVSNTVDSISSWFKLPLARTFEITDSFFAGAIRDENLIAAMRNNQNVYLAVKMLDEKYYNKFPWRNITVTQEIVDVRANTKIMDKPDYLGASKDMIVEAKGVGYVDVMYREDGLVREVPLVAICNEKFYPALAFSVYLDLKQVKQIDLPQSRIINVGGKDMRLTEGYGFPVHFTASLDDFNRITVDSMLTGDIPANTFKDKVVFIGSSFAPYSMSVSTPANGSTPQMLLQANLYSNLINNQKALPTNLIVSFVITLIFASLAAYAIHVPWRKFSIPAFIVLMGVFFVIVFTSVRGSGARISFFTPAIGSLLALFAGYILYYQTEGRRRNYIRQMVKQFFPAEQEEDFFERFMDLPYLKLNRKSAVVAVYLQFEKKEKSLQEALKSFEEFRTTVLNIARKHGGLRMSFMGNSSLFLFTGDLGYAQSCKASLEMRRFFTNFKGKYEAEGIGEFKLGIGIASGETLVSTLGKVPLVDLAVFGSPIILARQLALMNFEQKTKILIEEGLVNHMPQGAKVRELGVLEIVDLERTVYEYLR